MLYRVATIADIPGIQRVRRSVKENVLSSTTRISDENCREYIEDRGRGWVCVDMGKVVGFAIADLKDENIWALFVLPEFEGKGIGTRLQRIMLDWYFGMGKEGVKLSTSPNTRAEKFYLKSGWEKAGWNSEDEIKFTMCEARWRKCCSAKNKHNITIESAS